MTNKIDNDKYIEYWNSIDNQKIMDRASLKFKGLIQEDELESCKMFALWNSMKLFDVNGGMKFTSFLYNSVVQECRHCLVSYNKYHQSIESLTNRKHDKQYNFEELRDAVDALPSDLSVLIEQKFLMNMTLHEIAINHGCCHETIRRKIRKALCYLKQIMT